MGFAAGVGFIVDTNGDGTSDGKAVTLKKGSNITMSLSGSTLTINSTGGGGGSAITIQDEGSSLSTAAETIDFVGAGVTATGTGTTKTITIPGTDTNTQLTQEQVEDFVGGMLDGTETFIDVSYDDTDGNIDFVVPVKDEDNMASNSATHLATQQSIKSYVDSVASGLDVKDSVRVATTASITLSNQQTIDGVSVVAGNRVLVKEQSTASENGIYLCVDGGSWTRATDLAAGDTAAGFFTFVEEGTVNADIGYVCTSNAGADTVGTHSLAFAQFSAPGQVTAGTLLDKSGSTLNVDLSEAAAAVMAEADEFVFLDNDDSSASKRESLSDLLDTIAGTVATTGLDRSGATLVVSDLHPVGVSGSENQLLTDDGDGTVTSESGLTFDGDDLKILGTASGKPTLTLENSTSVASAANEPEIIFLRSGASNAATSGDLGRILFKGLDSDDNLHTYAQITGEALDETSGTEDGRLRFVALIPNKDDGAGNHNVVGEVEFLRLAGTEGIVFNTDGEDINFRIESDDDPNMFFVDAGNNKIGIGTGSPQTDLEIRDTTASSATQGGSLRLSSDDGAVMASGHRLGVIEFAGAEDSSNNITVGGRIEVLCDGAWSGSANAASMVFYTTSGDATQGQVMTLASDKQITTNGGIAVQTGASSGQKALYLRHQDADVIALDIAADNTTADVVYISAPSLTTANVLNVSATGLTDGKLLSAATTSTVSDGGTSTLISTAMTNDGLGSQTAKGMFLDYNKTGVTASGKTATVTGLHLDMDDSATNVGTVTMTGIDVDLNFGDDGGTVTNIGLDVNVAGADENYAIKLTGGSLLLGTLSAAPAAVSTYGQLWVKDNGSGADNTELYFTNDNGDDIQITDGNSLAASSLAFTTISVAGQSDVVADSATDTLTFAAGSNIAIATDAGGDQITISATGTISGGITVQEEGVALTTLGDTLNFVGSSVTASGTGTTKTITISGGGAFERSSNIIKTTETIGIGGSNAQELSLTDGGALNSEAVMANNGTNSGVVTKGMGMRKNVTIVVPDADTGDDTYTVAPTDHIIMLCNVKPSDGAQNASQIIRHVQLPQISTTYVGREITVVLHAITGFSTDNITVKPSNDDVILYHGRMWDNNMTAGTHDQLGSALGGDGMSMGHGVGHDINWAVMGQISVVAATMVAVDHGRLSALLGGGDPPIPISNDPTTWATGQDAITADVWLVTSISGISTGSSGVAMQRQQSSLGNGFEMLMTQAIGG